MGRQRTNIEIEDAYVQAIMDRFGVRTKTEAVDLALRHLAGQAPDSGRGAGHAGGARHRRGAGGRSAGYSVILADTSAWVEYDRATRSAVDHRVAELVGSDDGLHAVTEPVVMEVVAGARDGERESDMRQLLRRFHLLRLDSAADFDAAARIYPSSRRHAVGHGRLHDRVGGPCGTAPPFAPPTPIFTASPVSSGSRSTEPPQAPDTRHPAIAPGAATNCGPTGRPYALGGPAEPPATPGAEAGRRRLPPAAPAWPGAPWRR